ncbi:MAG TPA: hypothetical protein PLP29_13075 [Candidatus Ozemobacteraceae bacterium]|nr:hypothetical protein [Candidatus Ozemobacteraceae bacterium]
MSRLRSIFVVAAFASLMFAPDAALAAGPSTNGQKILGQAPVNYGSGKTVRKTHNEDAVVTRIWAPGLDDKFVPQGLTWASPYVLVGGYIWDGTADDKAVECRVYRIDPATGETRGMFTLGPIAKGALCKHAGGLAYAGRGILFVSDTHHVFKIDLEKAFELGSAFDNEALLARVELGGSGDDEVVGSFAAWSRKSSVRAASVPVVPSAKPGAAGAAANPFLGGLVDSAENDTGASSHDTPVLAGKETPVSVSAALSGTLWLGRYTGGEDREKNTRIYEFPASLIDWANPATRQVRTLTAADASTSLWISAGAQGGAFDRDGNLWISRTVTRWFEKTSVLHKKDPKTGDIIAKYDILHGLEDFAFDDKGYLWIVSESGTWKYKDWRVFSRFRVIDDFYPLLIRIDVKRLKAYD